MSFEINDNKYNGVSSLWGLKMSDFVQIRVLNVKFI